MAFRQWLRGTARTSRGILGEIFSAVSWMARDVRILAQGAFTGNRGKIRIGARSLCRDSGRFFNQVALLLAFDLLRTVLGLIQAAKWALRGLVGGCRPDGGL